jgi:hypothetical protein
MVGRDSLEHQRAAMVRGARAHRGGEAEINWN